MWETGQKVVSSVGTAGHERGKGLATKLLAEMVAKSNELGFARLGLAVRADNIPAKERTKKLDSFCAVNLLFLKEIKSRS